MSFSHIDYLPVSVGTFTFATIKQFLQEKMKNIIMTLIAVVTFSSSSARADAWPVVNHTIQAEGTPIVFNICIDTTTGNIRLPKTLVLIPYVCQNSYTLEFISGCSGATIILVDESGVEILSAYATGERLSISLPDYLQGKYYLLIYRGDYCFSGIIHLT